MISNIKKSKFRRAQIETPIEIVELSWQIIAMYRTSIGRVIDLGAGDGRFSLFGKYASYEGVEIDKTRYENNKMPQKAKIKYCCAFRYKKSNFDACIGNPPYVKRNDIERKWRRKIAEQINSKLDVNLNQHCNLFVYFICLGIIKTKPNGIIVMIVPYEWAYRPSAKFLRDYINAQGWSVHIYRFKKQIFKKVETTSCITIIDKNDRLGRWHFYRIDRDLRIFPTKNILGTHLPLLKYERRGDIWSLRGLSPGTIKVFTLSEEERIHHNLRLTDVSPCVTSLRHVPKNLISISKKSFEKHFIKSGYKCWLIRSDRNLSSRLRTYLNGIAKEERDTHTCRIQNPWYSFRCHPSPKILYGSGFTVFGPKLVINKIGAKAVGSVHGIHSNIKMNLYKLRNHLQNTNFEKQVVAYSGSLKKIEVRQMNTVLNRYQSEIMKGRKG